MREFYEAAAAEAGVRLEVEIRGFVAAKMDRPLLQRAIGNLIENALKHTPAGGTITLVAEKNGAGVCIEVRDTGCGIPAEHLPHLFDRFYRVDRARSSDNGSVGLGLAIVKSITELHGGSVSLNSEVGKGTAVVLDFPNQFPSHKAVVVIHV